MILDSSKPWTLRQLFQFLEASRHTGSMEIQLGGFYNIITALRGPDIANNTEAIALKALHTEQVRSLIEGWCRGDVATEVPTLGHLTALREELRKRVTLNNVENGEGDLMHPIRHLIHAYDDMIYHQLLAPWNSREEV